MLITTPSTTTLTKPIQTIGKLGSELISAVYEKDLVKIHSLLSAGADVNYRDPRGNTPLHYLFGYYYCNPEVAELFLNAGADPSSRNAAGLTPYRLAEERCPAKDWQTLKPIFDQFLATPLAWVKPQTRTVSKPTLSTAVSANTFNVTAINNETTSVAPKLSYEKLGMCVLPVSSLVNGSLSVGMDRLEERNKRHATYLPSVIHYGLKPITLAATSASINSIFLGSASSLGLEAEAGIWASFFSYSVLNYFGLLIAQPIERALAKRLQNKAFNILFPIVLYTAFLNPGLFFSESFLLEIIPMLMMSLMNGLLFKTGEWGTQKALDRMSFFKVNTEAEHLSSIVCLSREEQQLLPIHFSEVADASSTQPTSNADNSMCEFAVQDIINFRLRIVREDIDKLISSLRDIPRLKVLESLHESLKECKEFKDLSRMKNNLNDFYAKNKDNLNLKEIISPILNYIMALDKDWHALCAPNFLTNCLMLDAENENSNHVSGHLLLSKSNLLVLRFEFLKLEMFNFYLEVNKNSKRNTFVGLVANETEETLSETTRIALQAIKAIFFDKELTCIAGQVFSDSSVDLLTNCQLLATHFSVVIKQFDCLKTIFYKIEDANLRLAFLERLDSSSHLCKQRADFAVSIINRFDLFSKGKRQGIQTTLAIFASLAEMEQQDQNRIESVDVGNVSSTPGVSRLNVQR